MAYPLDNPLIVQSDKSVLVEVDHPRYEEARDHLARFAELVKSPEHVHTYRITPLSLWNAAATGLTAAEIIRVLTDFGKYDLPDNVRVDILDYVSRYGRAQLVRDQGQLLLVSTDPVLITELWNQKPLQPFLHARRDAHTLVVDELQRGYLKQSLIKIGYPVEDLAGYVPGAPQDIRLRDVTSQGEPFHLRRYQLEATDLFYAGGAARGGSGVVVLPCGAGKTMVGMGAMEKVQAQTLIITTATVAAHQWIAELLDKTWIPQEDLGEYTGDHKDLRPITVTTYQTLTYRPRRSQDFPHLELFNAQNWGLIIYDEVHLLPAPVFRVTAEIQARRRLGLTATLVREDGREDDVFSLIGPKKYDVPWRDLEKQGWIAEATCYEIRLSLSPSDRLVYATTPARNKYRVAAENPAKIEMAARLLERHTDDQVLLIGQFIEQLETLAARFRAPLITGQMRNREREELFQKFRRGEVKHLVVSKVANFSLDLPEANVAIQVSGTFGSRQEEAQRLGRILRPKPNGNQARFYSLVTRDTCDQEFAANRQLFLTEQGYKYLIYDTLPPN